LLLLLGEIVVGRSTLKVVGWPAVVAAANGQPGRCGGAAHVKISRLLIHAGLEKEDQCILALAALLALNSYRQVSPVSLLSGCQVDPVVDHDGVFVAEVIADAFGSGRTLSLDVIWMLLLLLLLLLWTEISAAVLLLLSTVVAVSVAAGEDVRPVHPPILVAAAEDCRRRRCHHERHEEEQLHPFLIRSRLRTRRRRRGAFKRGRSHTPP